MFQVTVPFWDVGAKPAADSAHLSLLTKDRNDNAEGS
jgi:hypothetical protein